MSLTKEALKQIGDLMDERIAASEERVYRRIKDNALGEVTKRLDGIDRRLDSMAEDVAKIPQIESELRLMNGNIQALRDHAGI